MTCDLSSARRSAHGAGGASTPWTRTSRVAASCAAGVSAHIAECHVVGLSPFPLGMAGVVRHRLWVVVLLEFMVLSLPSLVLIVFL